jgi:hypothetical protein
MDFDFSTRDSSIAMNGHNADDAQGLEKLKGSSGSQEWQSGWHSSTCVQIAECDRTQQLLQLPDHEQLRKRVLIQFQRENVALTSIAAMHSTTIYRDFRM